MSRGLGDVYKRQVRAFVYLVRVAGLIGITGILICLQIRLYRYKSALIEKEK